MSGMKIVAAALVGVLLAGCEQGSYFNSETEQLRSDRVGRLEAVGEDLRVYEFTPQTDSTRQCVFVAGDKKGGLWCWQKTGAAPSVPSQ